MCTKKQRCLARQGVLAAMDGVQQPFAHELACRVLRQFDHEQARFGPNEAFVRRPYVEMLSRKIRKRRRKTRTRKTRPVRSFLDSSPLSVQTFARVGRADFHGIRRHMRLAAVPLAGTRRWNALLVARKLDEHAQLLLRERRQHAPTERTRK